jgi:hypothetical protein
VDKINTKPAETAAQHRDDTNSLRLVINNPRFYKNGQARRAKEQSRPAQRVSSRIFVAARPPADCQVVSQLPLTKAVPFAVLSRRTTSRALDQTAMGCEPG